MASNNEIITLNVDVSKAEIAIGDILKGTGSLNALVKEISVTITNAFSSLQICLQKIEINTAAIASAVANTAAALENCSALFQESSPTDRWAQEIMETVDYAASAIGIILSAVGILLAAPVSPAITAIVAAVMAVVAGIIWAITEVVEHWDEISQALTVFFTETLPQLWSQFAEWIGGIVGAVTEFISPTLDWISEKVQMGIGFVQSIFTKLSAFLSGVFAKDWTEQFGAFGNVLNAFFGSVENIWNAIKGIFSGIVDFIKNVFAGNWSGAWENIVGIFQNIWDIIVERVKIPVNGLIGLINGLISGVVTGINAVIRALNRVSFNLPNWDIFGDMAGKSFGFNLKLLNAPQIPYLAQGAVLPANRPFLAVVGDQKHGTNVEAPLATIQQAVTVALDSRMGAMMEVFREMLSEQRATRQSVESIHIGDDMLARAVDRYNRKMAVVYGTGRI